MLSVESFDQSFSCSHPWAECKEKPRQKVGLIVWLRICLPPVEGAIDWQRIESSAAAAECRAKEITDCELQFQAASPIMWELANKETITRGKIGDKYNTFTDCTLYSQQQSNNWFNKRGKEWERGCQIPSVFGELGTFLLNVRLPFATC